MTLLVGGESPWLTPTETPGAMYFPALSAVPLVAPPLAARGFRVLLAGPLGPEPSLNQSRPRPPRKRSSTPGTAAGEGAGRRGELQPFPGRDLADPAVEQHARQDLVLRHRRVSRSA